MESSEVKGRRCSTRYLIAVNSVTWGSYILPDVVVETLREVEREESEKRARREREESKKRARREAAKMFIEAPNVTQTLRQIPVIRYGKPLR